MNSHRDEACHATHVGLLGILRAGRADGDPRGGDPMISRARGMVVAVVIGTLAARVSAQGADASWERIAGPLDPPPAVGHQLIHDPLRHRMLLLDSGPLDALWVMSLPATGPIEWQRVPIPGVHPDYRVAFAAAYDPRRDRVLLFGGRRFDLMTGATVDENDVWALAIKDTPMWSKVEVGGPPPSGRINAIFTYDPVRDRMVMFGGTSNEIYPTDTWSLDLAGAPTWRPLAPVGNRSPIGREGAAGVYDPWNDRLLLFGGWNGGIHDDLWSLALAGQTRWDTLPVSPRPPARGHCTAIVDPIHAELVVTNGRGWQSGAELSDAWALNLTGIRSWRRIDVSGDVPAIGGECGIFSPERNSIIEYGGDSNPTLCREMNLDDGRWTSLLGPQPDPMPVRRGSSLLMTDPAADRLLVFGGVSWDCQPDLWSFSLSGAPSWSHLPADGAAPACTAANLVFDPVRRRILAFLSPLPAVQGTSLDQVWALPLDEPRAWTRLDPAGPLPPGRIGFSLLYDPRRDRVLLFGGEIFYRRSDDSGESQDDVWELSLADTLRWRQLTPTGTPGPRDEQTAVYDYARDRMIVFQGEQSEPCSYYCSHELDDAWALSLGDSLAWHRVGPAAPVRGNLVLDPGRDRLVVWPGDNSAWTLSLSDTTAWRPLAIDGGLPMPRTLSGFVFDPTRDRMFVMGGMQMLFSDFGSFTGDVLALRFAGTSGTQVALRESRVTPATVELSWMGLAPIQPVVIVRAEGAGAFTALAGLAADAGGAVSFRDATVVPGRHYRYALSLEAGARRLGETTIDVPFAPAFALGGAYPNPAVRDLSLAFSLLDASPARLDVFDLAGRRVAERDVGPMGAGRHLLSMGRFAPGVYVVRLTQGAHSASIRAAIVR